MITQETIARVREHADIVAIVGETVKLQRRGRSLVGLCPFHKEKTPSLHVNPERGFFYCFGCHEKGDAIGFLMKIEGLPFADAVRRLAERIGIEIVEDHDGEGPRRARAQRPGQDLYDVSALAAAYFETQLREHPASRVAREELARRGLRPTSATDLIADALQAFRVGYAPPGWDGLASHLQRNGVSPLAAEQVGLLVPRKTQGGHYDRFRNRLMFGVVDVQGRVVAFSGRVLPDPETGEVDKETGKYINSPESPIYKKGEVVFGLFQARQAIREREQAVVVEGNFDVVSLHARAVKHVVAPLGTAFTSMQAKLLRRFASRLVMLFDGDTAGRDAVRKSRGPCSEVGLDARVAVLPQGKDPDDYIREKGAEALEKVIGDARGMLEYLIEVELDKDFARRDTQDRLARVQAVAALIQSEQDPAARSMARGYADRIAALMSTDLGMIEQRTFRAVYDAVHRALGGGSGRKLSDLSPDRVRSRDREGEIPMEMLGCVLDCPEILDDPKVQDAAGLLEGEIALTLGLARNLRDGKRLSAESFVARVPATIQDFAARRLASPRHQEPDEALQEFLQNAQKIKRIGLARDKASVVQELDRAGSAGDTDLEVRLLREAERKAREKLGLG